MAGVSRDKICGELWEECISKIYAAKAANWFHIHSNRTAVTGCKCSALQQLTMPPNMAA